MTNQEKISIIEEIMELDEGTLDETSVLEEYEEWDSLSKLALMAEVKKRFGKKLTQEEIRQFVIVLDVCNYME